MQEIELIAECKKYNPLAQRIVYKKYYSLFIRISNRYINNKEDSKDIVQDAFIKIFSNINKFKSEGSFEGWMKKNNSKRHPYFPEKKSKINTETIADFTELEENINKIDDQNNQEDNTPLYTEEELLAAIHSLPENLRSVFNLICLEDYSHKEVSSLLDISEENSRIRLMKARIKLKKILELKTVMIGGINYGR